MRRLTKHAVLALSLVISSGCARRLPPAYAQARAAAEAAYAKGKYVEAADHWRRAAEHADRQRDADEARYRRAASFARARQLNLARDAYDQLLRDRPTTERAPRAAYDLARIGLDRGSAPRAYALFDHIVRRYPASGLAPSALRQSLEFQRRAGEKALRRYLTDVARETGDSELGELLRYAYAQSLEREGLLKAARDQYLSTASLHPYPLGAYWDDALFAAANIEVNLGRPRRAIGILLGMLSQRETSHWQGSYERGRFAEARFRVAELYRDALDEPELARRHFATLWREHRTSRLRDDAKWQEALVAHRTGDRAGACRATGELRKKQPESRYAPCAKLLCPRLAGSDRCRPYIRRGAGLGLR